MVRGYRLGNDTERVDLVWSNGSELSGEEESWKELSVDILGKLVWVDKEGSGSSITFLIPGCGIRIGFEGEPLDLLACTSQSSRNVVIFIP